MLDSILSLNIFRPAEFAESDRCRRWLDISEPFCIERRLIGSFENNPQRMVSCLHDGSDFSQAPPELGVAGIEYF
ncbi:MAG: hypothetical protein DMC60_13640 [Verrucomicrobia bacterium]|nr:MAG: hypothetical protein DMC60_13640 [Verrucomicrobiota bacterium]